MTILQCLSKYGFAIRDRGIAAQNRYAVDEPGLLRETLFVGRSELVERNSPTLESE